MALFQVVLSKQEFQEKRMDWVSRNRGLKLEQISSILGIGCIHERLNTWPQMTFFDHGGLQSSSLISVIRELFSADPEDSYTSH